MTNLTGVQLLSGAATVRGRLGLQCWLPTHHVLHRTTPSRRGECHHTITGSSQSKARVHNCFVLRWAMCISGNDWALAVLSYRDRQPPVTLGALLWSTARWAVRSPLALRKQY
jgi:hypothetical protein